MKTSFYICILLGIFSCNSIVDVELEPHDSLVSVYCMMGDSNNEISVCLGYSKGINEVENPGFLEDAEIIIKKDGILLGTSFEYNPEIGCNEGVDELLLNEAGSEYYLEVNHPDFETVSARQILPKTPIIDEATYEAVDGNDPLRGTSFDRMKIRFSDDANSVDYYHVQTLIRNICCEEDFYSIWTWSDNFLLEETVGSQGLIFNDNSFNGTEMTLDLKLENTYIEPNNHYLYVRFSKITRDRYLYLKSKKTYYDTEGNPFSEPVTIHSNIEGGYGIFGLESVNLLVVEY